MTLFHDALGRAFTSRLYRIETFPGCVVVRCGGSGSRRGFRRTRILLVGTVGWKAS